MLGAGLDIVIDRNGLPLVMFRSDRREIMPPETKEEKLEWIRASFSRFYSRLCERDDLHKHSKTEALVA